MSNLPPLSLSPDMSTEDGRLHFAIAYLRQVHAENRRFNISNWINESECGTVACAAGWLALTPEFKALGVFTITAFNSCSEGDKVPALNVGGGTFFGAAPFHHLLGLTYAQTSAAFYSSEYHKPNVTAADVADRLESFLQARLALSAIFATSSLEQV